MLLSEFCPAACHSSSFQLRYVTISEPCHLLKFTLTGPHKLLHTQEIEVIHQQHELSDAFHSSLGLQQTLQTNQIFTSEHTYIPTYITFIYSE